MFQKATILTLLILLSSGCASVDVPALANNHPANPAADEAPISNIGDVFGTIAGGISVRHSSDVDPMSNHRHHQESEGVGEGFFTCPMHPKIRGIEGGKCPICNMNLVEEFEGGGNQ